MKIVLLGYMASGKSTIGRRLAKRIGLSFIDLDSYIEEKEGRSVSAIFEEEGEIYFRLQEHRYVKELLSFTNDFVLALGGGTPCYAGNMNLLRNNEDVISVFLQVTIPAVVDRLRNEKATRPLVADLSDEKLTEFVAKHLFERGFFYEQATHKITTHDKELSVIVDEIEVLLR